jgi:hypothetical protein
LFPAEVEFAGRWNSGDFGAVDGGKSHDMGSGARRARADADLSSEIGAARDRQTPRTDGKKAAR